MGAASETIVFRGSSLEVGKFLCPPTHELWSKENCTGDLACIAFPRVAVGIKQANHSAVVATPNHVMFYNAHHPYRRHLIDPRGDECEFFSVTATLLEEVMRSFDLTSKSDLMATPFPFSHAPCPAVIYLKQRALFQLLQASPDRDSLFLEEQYMHLLHQLIQSTFTFQSSLLLDQNQPCPFQREQVSAATEFIAVNYCRSLKIEEVAGSVDCSVYHFCRIFKKFAGVTVHKFLTQCRLRSSIERLLETERSILDIALDLGFSSQSHFTSSFRKSFGLSPGSFRSTRGQTVLQS